MVRSVSQPRPVDLLRQSGDQIRRAADLLAEITAETAVPPLAPSAGASGGTRPDADATILTAQRRFAAGLRLDLTDQDRPR